MLRDRIESLFKKAGGLEAAQEVRLPSVSPAVTFEGGRTSYNPGSGGLSPLVVTVNWSSVPPDPSTTS